MAAYLIFMREGAIFNPGEMEQYGKLAQAVPNTVGLKPLVIYGDLEALEGKAPEGVVVLEFQTMEDAKTWYHSPEYQAAAAHRKKGADYRVLLVGGL